MARLGKLGSRPGAVLVEMAIVMGLLVLLLFGLIEYGFMLLRAQQITNAARYGARIGITIDSTNTRVEQAIASAMSTAGMGDSGYTVTFVPGDVTGLTGRETLTITVSVLYENVGAGMPLVPVPTNLSASVSMASER